jgi:hypothetical protein
MMKTITLPTGFDGAKFAERYGLDTQSDFFVVDGVLHFPEALPDTPVLEAPDPLIIRLRKAAAKLADEPDPSNKVLRGVLAALIDELNMHALKINSILSAVDAATSLADFKSRVALINDYPQRTMAQAVAAVKDKINDGTAD